MRTPEEIIEDECIASDEDVTALKGLLAERDAAVQAAEQAEETSNGYARALLTMTEKKQAAEQAADSMTLTLAKMTRQAEAAEQAAEQARAALQESALAYHTSNSHPRDFDICTWPQCRHARAALGNNT